VVNWINCFPMPQPDGRTRAVHGPSLWAETVVVTLVQGYRLFFKAWVGNVCRYEPSCSSYMLQAVQQHGAGHGVRLGVWRIMRCNPWCRGGCDPVPERDPASARIKLFTRLLADTDGAAPHADARADLTKDQR
jgi:putative membrane protein insertion efficiency factor